MAQQNFNFQRLAEQLGLKNVADLPVVEAITPTVVIGDGSQITAPLLPASAVGGDARGVGVGEHAVLQLRSLGAGGVFVEQFRVGGQTQTDWRVDRAGVADPLAADPLTPAQDVVPFQTGFGETLSNLRIGNTTVNIQTNVPSFFNALSSGDYTGSIFLEKGGLLTLSAATTNTVGYFFIQWREVPSASLFDPTPA